MKALLILISVFSVIMYFLKCCGEAKEEQRKNDRYVYPKKNEYE